MPLQNFRTLSVVALAIILMATAGDAEGAPETPATATQIEFHSRNQEIAPTWFEILVDKAGALNAESALNSKSGWAVTPSPLAYGFSDAVLWIRLRVRNTSEASGFYLINAAPYVERMELFVFRDGRRVSSAVDGSLLPASQRVRPRSPDPVVYFQAPRGAEVVLLLRVSSNSSLYIEPILATSLAYGARSARSAIWQGFYFGVIGLTFLINLALYLLTANRGFLLYCIYALIAAAYQLAYVGYARVLLWPEAGAWNSHSLVVLGSATFLAVAAFSAHFLALGRRRPWARNVLLALSVLIAANTLASFVAPVRLSDQLAHLLATTTSLFLLFLGILSWARGLKIARYYVVAWSALIVCIIVFNLFALGLIEWPLARHSIQIGTGLEMLLFNAALLDRIAAARADNSIRSRVGALDASATPAETAYPPASLDDDSSGARAARIGARDIPALLAALRRQMEDNQLYLDEDLNLNMLARAIGVRKDQLSFLLNQELDVSFADFVNRYRVEAARIRLLEDPESSILSIAFSVGFNTKSAFYEAFRKFTGKNPGDFRRSPALGRAN